MLICCSRNTYYN